MAGKRSTLASSPACRNEIPAARINKTASIKENKYDCFLFLLEAHDMITSFRLIMVIISFAG